MTRLSAKILTNTTLLIIAVVSGSIVWSGWSKHQWIDEFGDNRIQSHMREIHNQSIKIDKLLNNGNTEKVRKLLGKTPWNDVYYGDRAHPAKTHLLHRLCLQLYQNKDYNALLKWAGVWRDLHDRDVNASAFWYEALRHTEDRKKEGFYGLQQEFKRFPDNVILTSFVAVAYKETGENALANKLFKQLAENQSVAAVKGWQLFWTTQIDQREFEFSGVTLSRSDSKSNTFIIDVPSGVKKLRLDLPPNSSLQLSNLEFGVDGEFRAIGVKEKYLNDITLFDQTLITYWPTDPFLVVNPELLEQVINSSSSNLSIRFQLKYLQIGVAHPVIREN